MRFLVRRLSPLPALPLGVELVLGDLDDGLALQRLVRGADAVVHLAGAIKARRDAEFRHVNAEGTARLAAACDPGTLLLALSSLAAREPDLSPYARSKREAEQCLVRSGLPRWLAIRAPVVYGPGDRETLALFRLAQRGIAPLAAGIDARLSVIHAADLVRLVADCLDRPPAPDVYEVDDGAAEGHRLKDVLALAAELQGRRIRTLSLPRPVMMMAATVAQAGARLGRRAAILSAGKVREMFHPDWVARDRRLALHLSFVPAFDIRRGFAETISWYGHHNWL